MSSTDISLVVTLIAAYKDGIKIADRIKRKRVEKGVVPPPEQLEKALRDGEVRITEVRDENRDVKVDVEAQMALKDLIIEVQGTLLHQLVEAELDDSFDDFTAAIQMAVRTRRRAINVLNDLYERTEDEAWRLKGQADAEAARARQEEDERKRRLIEEEDQKQRLYDDGPELASPVSRPRPLTVPVGQMPKEEVVVMESSPRRFWSTKSKAKKQDPTHSNTTTNSTNTNTITNSTNTNTITNTITNTNTNRASLISEPYSTIGSPTLQPSPLSPRLSASPQHFTTQSSPQATIQHTTQHSPLLSAQTPRSRSTWSTTSTTPTSPALAAVPIQPLTKTGNLGGFCKGAWYAQNLRLDKATGKPSLRSYGWAFYCKKCNYRVQADVRDRNHPRFDDRIYQTQTTRFRLLFLLKSHLPLKSARDPRVYACLLCALAGTPKRCNGEDHLIEHVQRHAKETFGDTYLDGPISISPDGVHIESMRSFDLVFGTTAADDDAAAGGAQWLDGREVEFALPPPAELDASEPLTTQVPHLRLTGGLFGTT